MKTNNCLYEKPKYPLSSGKTKSRGSSPFPSDHVIDNHQFNNSRPFKTSSNDLSFEGLSFKGGSKPLISVSKAIEKYADEFGETAAKDFQEKINKAATFKNSGIKVKGDTAEFKKPSTMGERAMDAFIVYPATKMHLDLANSTIKGLRKVFKDSKTLEKWANNPKLKERAELVEHRANVAGIESFFKLATDGKSAFEKGHNRLNPNVSNYNSTTERTLTRIVTGMIPAFFLANDAYNLSRVLKDDDKVAKKAKKRRFKQETVRIALAAGFMFATMKTFAKQTNKSPVASALVTAGTVVTSEIISRLIAGNPITPVGEDGAKKYAEKHGRTKKKIEKKDSNKNSNTAFRAMTSNAYYRNERTAKAFSAFKGMEGFEGKKVPPREYKAPHKGKMTTANILKVLGGLVVFGFGVEKGSKIKPVEKFLKTTGKKYKNLIQKDFTVSRKEFNEITKKLDGNGFDKVANKYRDMVKHQKGDTLNLGKVDHAVKEPLINKVLIFPFRFSYDVAMIPYKKVVKPAISGIFNKAMGYKTVKKAKTAKQIEKDNNTLLRNSVLFLRKAGQKDGDEYKKVVSKSILSSLDSKTKSTYSNAEMAVLAGTAARASSSGFLITDNYNMVMIDSEGKDKELAAQKARERSVQRANRIVYGAFIIKLVNGLFSSVYNKSLLGAQAVNVGNTLFIESLTRKSVGLPVGESNRKEILAIEENNLTADGLKGGYFRTMAALTGKKPLSHRASKKAEHAKKAS